MQRHDFEKKREMVICGMILDTNKVSFEHAWMSVSHLWSLMEIRFEIFQCFL